MICANIGAEWITQTRYAFSDASARVHGQGRVMSDIVIDFLIAIIRSLFAP